MRRRHKYNVAPREERTRDGIVFASKKEMRYYDRLKILMEAGEVLWFARQPRFVLPGGVEYVADFAVCEGANHPCSWVAGTEKHWMEAVRIVDVKGHRTEMYRLKKKQVEAIYGIQIEEV